MSKRFITSVMALPLLIFFAYSGGNLLLFALTVVSLIGMFEVYRAILKNPFGIGILGYVFCIIFMLSLKYISYQFFSVFLIIFVVTLFITMVFLHTKIKFTDVLVVLFGFFYVPFMLSNIYIIRENTDGIFYIWLAFISAWGCDVGAYFAGVKFGKTKLIPTLSPNKTVEGSVGGVCFSVILGIIYAFVITRINQNFSGNNFIIVSALICFFGSIVSQFGDLTASAMKRYTGIKDFGKIMPGHGGIIDRFDSVLFTAPITYVVLFIFYY